MTLSKLYRTAFVAAVLASTASAAPGTPAGTGAAKVTNSTKAIAALNPFVQDSAALAQKDLPLHAHIAVIGKTIDDSVVIRWAPSKPGGWLSANKTGYVVERAIVPDKVTGNGIVFDRLTPQPLKPWTLEEWKAKSGKDDRLAAIAAQVLYGKTAVLKAGPANDLSYLKFATEELENRWGFALFAADNGAHAAKGLALRFVDKTVKPGQKLVYRIFAASGDTSYHLDTGALFMEVKPAGKPVAPAGLIAEGEDGRIVLAWSASVPERFSGYLVERSADNGAHYVRLTKVPLVNVRNRLEHNDLLKFIDTAITNYQHYRYRVQGITPFAEYSAQTEIEAYGKDLTAPPSPMVSKPKRVPGNKLKIAWTMPATPADLTGFLVTRSPDPLRLFHPLTDKPLAKEAREFIDTALNPDEPYYIVSAIDTAGNIAASLPVYLVFRDSTPPATPTGFTGTIDTLGIVRLHWHANTESKMLGYRLMWANDPHHEFSQVTSQVVLDTSYVDTVSVKTLTRSVFFKLVAVNKWYIPSKPTAILEIRRPHLIKPVAPVITGISVTDSTVTLGWARSPSEMVAEQIVMRKNPGDTAWMPMAKVAPIDSGWVDRTVRHEVVYEYALAVKDSGNLTSPRSHAMQARPYYTGILPGVEKLSARSNSKTKQVELSWAYPHPPAGESWFIIYRSLDSAALSEYQSVTSTTLKFTDSRPPAGRKINYAVKCQTRAGEKSPLSKSVSVTLK